MRPNKSLKLTRPAAGYLEEVWPEEYRRGVSIGACPGWAA